MSGSGGNAGAAWNSACNGVSTNGRCNGAVFEWCDYYTMGLRTLDCATLGMTCQADELQPPEDERNGCVGDPCPADPMTTCDGRFIRDCSNGLTHVTDCEKVSGPGATCTETEGSHYCTRRVSCGFPGNEYCDGNIYVLCDEDGHLSAYDCGRCNPMTMCVETTDSAGCSPSIFDCDLP